MFRLNNTMQLRRTWLPYITLVSTLVFTLLSSYNAATTAKAKDELRFDAEVERTQEDIKNRLETYITLLRGTSGLFAASNEVRKQEFNAYVQRLQLQKRYSGIQGIGFAIRIKAEEITQLVVRMEKEGNQNFTLRPQQPIRNEYYPIIYLEPLNKRNQAAIGYDMFSEIQRRLAMEQARDTGAPAASGRVTLVQEIEEKKQAGFLIYVPIYRDKTMPDTLAERRKELLGFVYSPFRADDFIKGIFTKSNKPNINFAIYDTTVTTALNLLHNSQDVNLGKANQGGYFTKFKNLDIAGRTWRIIFTSSPEMDRDLEIRQIPYFLVGGVLLSLLLFFITRSLVRARLEAEKSEKRFRTLMEQSPLSTAIFSPQGKFVRVNQSWEELWGIKLKDARDYNVFRDKQLQEKGVMSYVKNAFAGKPGIIPPVLYDAGKNLESSVSIQKWIQAYIYPLRDEEGNIREVVVIHEDITQSKLAAEALTQSNEKLALLYSMSSGLLLHREPKEFISRIFRQLAHHLELEIYINYLLDKESQRLKLHSYSGLNEHLAQQIEWREIGETISGIVAQKKQSVVIKNVQQSSDEQVQMIRFLGVNAYACYPLLSNDELIGTLCFGSSNRPQFNPNELALMQVVCDLVATALERENLLNQLQRQTEELTQANRRKDEFLATLSHELRTPLNSLLGWSELLQTRILDEKIVARALETIQRSSKSLAQLIEDILDVSRIIQGKMQLNLSEIDLTSAVNVAIETVQGTAQTKEIVIETQLQPNVKILGDINRLQQIVWNLLSNAIKFTPSQGRIKVQLSTNAINPVSTYPPLPTLALLKITDTGQGINPEFLPYVFDRFRQADASITRNHGGLGLGLAIVRHLVELHGGTVEVDSLGEGKGATFTVKLPLLQQIQDIPKHKNKIDKLFSKTLSLNGLQILIIDDEADVRELVGMMLEEVGAEVTTTASTSQALEKLQHNHFDVILSDIAMPKEDGYAFIRKVRTLDAQETKNIPAIALTAYAGEIDKNQALAAGFQEHLAKPFDANCLVTTIARLTKRIS
jgi:PAS domain S-box-containing protein